MTDRAHVEAAVGTMKKRGSEIMLYRLCIVRCTGVNARAAFPVLAVQVHAQSTSEHSSIPVMTKDSTGNAEKSIINANSDQV